MAIMAKKRIPRRGDVWLVDFDPSVGEEIRKVRPAVVIGQDLLRHLALRVVVPLTDWKPRYAGRFCHVHISAKPPNGLAKDSGADAFQVKSVSNGTSSVIKCFYRMICDFEDRILRRQNLVVIT
jgi:mRNA interferase MazF